LDLFEEWKEELLSKINLKTHHLWNEIIATILSKLKDFLETEWEVKDSDIVVPFIAEWRSIVPLDSILETIVPTKLLSAVKLWDPLLDNIPVHEWILPWIELVGNHMENVIYVVWKKLSLSLLECDWVISDKSVLCAVLPWNNIFYPFLMEKLLLGTVLPKVKHFLRTFTINPEQQDLTEFWVIMEWYELYSQNGQLHEQFVLALEEEFFPLWLEVLFDWLGSDKCNILECVDWYLGWKELLSYGDLYSDLFVQFHRGLLLLERFLFVN